MICLQAFDSTMSLRRKIANLESAIHLIRGHRVMLDSDLAAIYGVSTRQLNQQLKRNRNRFPEDFAFQLGARRVQGFDVTICDIKQRPRRKAEAAMGIH